MGRRFGLKFHVLSVEKFGFDMVGGIAHCNHQRAGGNTLSLEWRLGKQGASSFILEAQAYRFAMLAGLCLYVYGNGQRLEVRMAFVVDLYDDRSLPFLKSTQVEFKLAFVAGILEDFDDGGIGNRPGEFEIGIRPKPLFLSKCLILPVSMLFISKAYCI